MMPRRVWLALALAVLPLPAAAQFHLEARAGVQFSSVLATDSIIQTLSVAPDLAPSAVLAGDAALGKDWSVTVAVRWSRSDLTRREAGQKYAVLPLTVWSGTVGLRRQLTPSISVEGTAGGIKYAPNGDRRDGTIFQDDAPLLPTAGVAARFERRLGGRWRVGLEAAYDFHRFTTQTLLASGLSSARSVHRVAVSVVLRRAMTHATP